MKFEIFMLGITKGVRESIMSNHISQWGKQGILCRRGFVQRKPTALTSLMT